MIKLSANGKEFRGWLTANVTRSMKAVAGSFEITYIGIDGENSDNFLIKPGDECSLEFENKKLITGFVDELSASYESDSRSLSVKGRDKTGDLVDSASIVPSKSFKGVSLVKMAKTLADPFGVSVSSLGGAGNASIKNVSLQPNETVWESISRFAKYQNVLAYPDAEGGIIFSKVGTKIIASFKEGLNIHALDVFLDASEKFQTYKIYINVGGANNKHKKFIEEIKDNSVKRPRVKAIHTNKIGTKEEAIERAKWEMASRIAKSFNINLTTNSWLDEKGQLWAINKLVQLESPSCGVNGTFLIEDTNFIFDENGFKTKLKLVLKDAYLPEPSREGGSVGEIGEV